MKPTAMLILAMLTTLSVFAHGYKLNPDSTVTFSINAPAADSVFVAGSIAPKRLPLEKAADGSWSVTTARLAPDMYYYWFVVDGVKTLDPKNPYVVRDIASLFNIFIQPGRQGDLYAVQDVPHGDVNKVWCSSPALGCERRMTVYTPAAYRSEPTRKFPVLYLLHGMGGDEDAWEGLGRTSVIMDNMIAAGTVEPMIVVMPNGNINEIAAPGYTAEGMYITDMNRSRGANNRYEASFSDIVSYVDANYRTIADKHHRALAGLSMGGGHAWRISLNHPDLFDYIGLYSAAVGWGNAEGETLADYDEALLRQFDNSPALYWIAIGKEDVLLNCNNEFRAQLDRLGLPYTYLESKGGHTWTNWRLYLSIFAQKLFK